MSSPAPAESLYISNRDWAVYHYALEKALEHSSGGDFDMVAVWYKGSDTQVGFNELTRPARRRRREYPEMAGIHAELALFRYNDRVSTRRDLTGGTVVIAGKKSKNSLTLQNTRPCLYCAALLHECGVTHAVFMQDGKLFKSKVASLL